MSKDSICPNCGQADNYKHIEGWHNASSHVQNIYLCGDCGSTTVVRRGENKGTTTVCRDGTVAATASGVVAKEHFTQIQRRVIQEIIEERARQDIQWGGPTHDDEHLPSDWFHFILKQATTYLDQKGTQSRERLIKIAALAIAGIESIDRVGVLNLGASHDHN